jgi:hypothetical protein
MPRDREFSLSNPPNWHVGSHQDQLGEGATAMTKPPGSGFDREEPSQPEGTPEVISDLDVTGDDADRIAGGNCRLSNEF